MVGGKRLLRADAARQMGEKARDVTAAEILANIDAMVWGVATVDPGGRITVETVQEVHRRLMADSRIQDHGCSIRTVQNWIGGSGHNPCSAAFVPPPPEDVPTLMDDLLPFCNDDGLSPLVQTAIAHAKFETIHPFVDGNGRAGRALIHLRVDSGRGQNRTLRPLAALWPPVFAGEQDVGHPRGEMWARSLGATVSPACFHCPTASWRWAVFQ